MKDDKTMQKIRVNEENFMEILKECQDLFQLKELYKTVDDENLKTYETNKDERIQQKRKRYSNNQEEN